MMRAVRHPACALPTASFAAQAQPTPSVSRRHQGFKGVALSLGLLSMLGVGAFILVGGLSTPVHAQSSRQQAEAEEDAAEAQQRAEARKDAKSAAPPSALPGAAAGGDSSHARMDVGPTEALFDAINKGALQAAKEAVGRGADLTAKNEVDQTPLDMAIDLGRNDIMFLLLSLRTYDPEGRLVLTAPKQHHLIPTHTERRESMAQRLAEERAHQREMAALAKQRRQRLVETDTPQPDVGFLGFKH
ncbi:ankyrin repeat domain-containing protein [Formicincola oecophyllae]|uniref:ankyrin repeat domain-containing protein n=1 Tax=Formicincola oecophyllae TaxID=2558361 RepID=UPI001F0D36F1|nr:ankyrin repeat domain-containing protein [Formicincola oecophyllae]